MTKQDPRGYLDKLPRTLRIAGNVFKVKIVGPRRKEIANNNGVCLVDSREILLHATMVKSGELSLIVNTVVHEITHGINCLFGISDNSTEENFTEYHTNGIIAFYVENPGYVAWMVQALGALSAPASDGGAGS